MGEIAPRRIAGTRHRVLLVGQAPGADGDLRPLTGTMGVRLAELSGVDQLVQSGGVPRDERIGLYFDRANVLDFYPGRPENGKGHAFPLGHARLAAQAMWPAVTRYERVLFCGRAVYDVFRTCQAPGVNLRRKEWRHLDPYHWHGYVAEGGQSFEFAWMHHTSMIVPWWNDPANVERARAFLTELASWTIWGRAAAA